MAISFGMFDWVDRRPMPIGQLYEERLALLEAADKADFFRYHTAEHHATPLGGFAWGDLTLEQSLRSLRLFADEVIPAFR